jgi:cellobiose-specific phosphotransferase system component IIC
MTTATIILLNPALVMPLLLRKAQNRLCEYIKLTVHSIPNPFLRIEFAQPTVHSFEGDL